MADKMSVVVRPYQMYEAGERPPKADGLAALARLGMDINWLLTGVGHMVRYPDGAQAQSAETSQIHRELQETPSGPQAASGEPASQCGDWTGKDIGARVRSAKHLLETACSAVGWEPPPLIGHLLHTMIFSYAIDLEDIISLLGAMKDEAQRGG